MCILLTPFINMLKVVILGHTSSLTIIGFLSKQRTSCGAELSQDETANNVTDVHVVILIPWGTFIRRNDARLSSLVFLR